MAPSRRAYHELVSFPLECTFRSEGQTVAIALSPATPAPMMRTLPGGTLQARKTRESV